MCHIKLTLTKSLLLIFLYSGLKSEGQAKSPAISPSVWWLPFLRMLLLSRYVWEKDVEIPSIFSFIFHVEFFVGFIHLDQGESRWLHQRQSEDRVRGGRADQSPPKKVSTPVDSQETQSHCGLFLPEYRQGDACRPLEVKIVAFLQFFWST